MDNRKYDPTWCRSLRDKSVKRERQGRTKRTARERLDDWLWSDETNLCEQLKPSNIEIRYRDSVGRLTTRLVTVEALIEKGRRRLFENVVPREGAERTFRTRDILEVVDLETGEIHLDVRAWLGERLRLSSTRQPEF